MLSRLNDVQYLNRGKPRLSQNKVFHETTQFVTLPLYRILGCSPSVGLRRSFGRASRRAPLSSAVVSMRGVVRCRTTPKERIPSVDSVDQTRDLNQSDPKLT